MLSSELDDTLFSEETSHSKPDPAESIEKKSKICDVSNIPQIIISFQFIIIHKDLVTLIK